MTRDTLDYDQLKDAIDGIYAYDGGAVSSGIRDESLRYRIIRQVRDLEPDVRRRLLSRMMRDLCLTDESIEQGYGWEDARDLGNWFDDQFGVG